ncbi:DNA-directed RNA polymerase subunit beta' [Candidatus Microgenomates bacterium]|nr:DNA-directed RNA polymerase subunit beta' [Candidatus Microgenomates bacterium]
MIKDSFTNVIDFSGLKINLASPEKIQSWSYGEITKPETINYRTLKPEKDGLFDERIFGPTKDWECFCGKYKRIRYRGIICDKCGVEVTQSKVRRERMGHIELATPIAHVWFFKGIPSTLSLLLNISPRNLEGVIYFAQYLVIEVDKEKRTKVLSEFEKRLEDKKENISKEFKTKREKIKKEMEIEEKRLKKKLKGETFELAISELKINKRNRLATLEDELIINLKKAEELFNNLTKIVKRLKPLGVLTEEEYFKLQDYQAEDFFEMGMGAEALLTMIRNLDLDKLANNLRKKAQETSGAAHVRATKRLRIIESLKKAEIDPSWMVMRVLPVLPPNLRPMVQLSGGRFATSDLNDLYRRVINRNNRLKHLINLGTPEIILRNEKRMLQEAVDSLIESNKVSSRGRTRRRPLRALSDMLRGKQGRFRQNLLGKRVDYSGRSVIVVGPELKLNQCGLPKAMALELFKPFVLRELIIRGISPNVKSAKNLLDTQPPQVFDILEEIIHDHPVLLNRAPTLHKLGIQAFYPILIEGSAIRIHPCVCAGYNADFDGDQMAVHVTLSKEAQKEAEELMLPEVNLLKPADGSPITLPNKEMALGCFWLTSIIEGQKEKEIIFSNTQEAILAYQLEKVDLREPIKIFLKEKIVKTTVGRIILNNSLPEELRFINREVKAVTLKRIITKALNFLPSSKVAELIDKIKEIGFWAATLAGGASLSVFDCRPISKKEEMIKRAEKNEGEIEKNFEQGLITEEEKRRLKNEIWIDMTEELADATWKNLKNDNPVKVIINSGGARASRDQLKQLAAMRGLVVDPLGKIVELPTKSNFREGLSIFEYVTSTRGSRKGLTDSALKTANAGYLTRRLVDVAHDAIIRIEDCGTDKGIEILREEARKASFEERILGRVLVRKVIDPKTKKVVIKEGEIITEENINFLTNIKKIKVRSPLMCEALFGLCKKCYGKDFSTQKYVEIGTPVGVIAAQSIGEPGTQLTMRVKHTGGIVGLDVTQGLPRVEELFEARTPKILSPIAEISGKIEITETSKGFKVRIRNEEIKPIEEVEYLVPLTSELKVKNNQKIRVGEQLASGFLSTQEVLNVRGLRETQKYLLIEIQRVYESQGIPINDKHFEVIIRKMSEKVKLETTGDTNFLPGEFVEQSKFEIENARVLSQGGEPATAQVIILGITKAALFTSSWLSAASFQNTTSVLTKAAICGQEDKLLGLKENVIIGRLIPTGKERAQIEK